MSAAGGSRDRKSDSTAAGMGDLLLKGYKMLAISCEVCNNVLMQDKQGNNICVSCRNEERDRSAKMDFDLLVNLSNEEQKQNEIQTNRSQNQVHENHSSRSSLSGSETILRNEIISTSLHLNSTQDVQAKLQLVTYIHKCAETINCLQKI